MKKLLKTAGWCLGAFVSAICMDTCVQKIWEGLNKEEEKEEE